MAKLKFYPGVVYIDAL